MIVTLLSYLLVFTISVVAVVGYAYEIRQTKRFDSELFATAVCMLIVAFVIAWMGGI